MSAEQCESFRELSSNVGYQCLLALKISFGVIGACGLCYQWCKEGVRFLVHNNTKIIFNMFYVLNVFVSTSFALFYLFELMRLHFECFVVNFRWIILTKGMIISAIGASHHVIMIISFERLYSALFPAHFEKNSSKKLALFLAVTVIIISLFITMHQLSHGFTLFQTRFVVILNERINENSDNFEALMIVSSTSYVFSLIMFTLDLYLNFVRKTGSVNPSLAVSYQRSENRRVILVILPIEITETLFTLTATSALFLQTKFNFIDTTIPMNAHFFLEIATLPAVIFPIFLAIIIDLRVSRRVQASVTAADENVDHFDNLRRAWEV